MDSLINHMFRDIYRLIINIITTIGVPIRKVISLDFE
jgi:hypothetical protein